MFLKSILVALFASIALPVMAERRMALVVGNSFYEHGPDLPNAVADARAVAQHFKNSGARSFLATDATREQFLSALIEFQAVATDATTVLVYIAAHGVQVDGKLHILFSDSDPAQGQTVPLDIIVRALSGSVRNKVFFVDACREYPNAELVVPATSQSNLGAYAGLHVLYAAQPGTPAFDGAQGHSPFAKSLLELPMGMEVTEIDRFIRKSVVNLTGGIQIPWSQSSLLGPAFPLGR